MMSDKEGIFINMEKQVLKGKNCLSLQADLIW